MYGITSTYGLSVVTGPTALPVTTDDVKTHARIDSDVEDAIVGVWVAAATNLTQQISGRRWITQTLKLTLADWPTLEGLNAGYVGPGAGAGWLRGAWGLLWTGAGIPIAVPVEPVQSVASVMYYGIDSAQHSQAFQTWLDHSPPLIAPAPGSFWPALQIAKLAPIEVTFVAGYGDTADDVPGDLKEAIYLTCTYWNEHRGDSKDPTEFGLPLGARMLLQHLGARGYA